MLRTLLTVSVFQDCMHASHLTWHTAIIVDHCINNSLCPAAKLAIVHNCLRPKFAILNPELTYTLPAFQTFCGAADIMSHVMERYFTSTTHTDLSDRLCESIIKSVIKNSLVIKDNPNDYNARAEIMWASTLAHNDLVGRGRAEDWASHMIGMEISAIYDSVHGATLSVLTPSWARYVYRNNLDRFVQFAVRVFDVAYARICVRKYSD